MNIFNYLKDKVNYKEIFQAYDVPYVEYGGDSVYIFKAQCPVKECKPKGHKKYLTVADSGIFYCTNCHQCGDVTTLIAILSDITPIDAVKKLISYYHDWKTKDKIRIPKEYEKESREMLGDYFVDLYLDKQNV